MNAARMYRRLKRDIGSYGIALPIDNLDEYMMEVIEDTTLPVFSIYEPREEPLVASTTEFKRDFNDTGDGCDVYLLPESMFVGREVLYVRRVEYATDTTEYYSRYVPNSTTARMGVMGNTGVSLLEGMILANAEKPISDTAINPVTFKYLYPRKLCIYDALVSTRLKITLACEHDTSLQSIPPTAGESFYSLALLDVEAALYQLVKPHEEIKGAYDNTELKIEDWKNAKQERKELLKEWDDLYGLDQGSLDFG